jgi:hypothetical protein
MLHLFLPSCFHSRTKVVCWLYMYQELCDTYRSSEKSTASRLTLQRRTMHHSPSKRELRGCRTELRWKVALASAHLHSMLCLLPVARSLLPPDQLKNNLTPRHPLNTLHLSTTSKCLADTLFPIGPTVCSSLLSPDQQGLTLDMTSVTAASADCGRKRRANEDLDVSAPRITAKEGRNEENTLKRKLETAIFREG